MIMNKALNCIPRLLVFLLLAVPVNCVAGGMSSWSETTPHGHEMRHDGSSSGIIELYMPSNAVFFKHFYFYKNHIIAYDNNTFYIINEKTETVQEFINRNEWKEQIKKQKLKPLWKREYDADYSTALFGRGYLIFLFLLPFPLLLPLLWLICLISLLFRTRWMIGFRYHFSWSYPVVVFIVWLFEIFPQSI